VIPLINSIKDGNLFHTLKKKPEPSQIYSAAINQVENLTLDELEFKKSLDSYFSSSFLTHFLNKLKTTYLFKPEMHGFSFGTIAIKSSGPFQILINLEAVLPSLTYQNVVLLFLSSPSDYETKFWQRLKSNLPNPNQFQILNFAEDLWEFAIKHPGVKGIYWNEPYMPELRIPPDLTPYLINKICYFVKASKNTFCVLEGAKLEEAASDLIDRIAEGKGLMPFSVSRVLVQQKIESKFKKVLQETLDTKVNSNSVVNNELLLQMNVPFYDLNQFIMEQGHVMIQRSFINILNNISNCSEWHQIPLNQSTAFWMDFKYPFEISKWVNNIPNHNQTIIWMETSQPKEWMLDIISHAICINRSLKNQKPPSFWTGVELSFSKKRVLVTI